jgi:rhodanese-related sulfurtransferase/DNA-binding transcriptional ArsR family regulator
VDAIDVSSPKRTIYERLGELAQALGHAHRLELLEQIAQGARSVDDLAAAAGMSVANTSRHLQVLRRARLVDADRRGKRVFYSLAGDTAVLDVLASLGRLAERNVADVQRVVREHFHQRDTLEAITRTALLARLRDRAVTILDVRSPAEFALGHLPGAVNVPLEQLEQRLAELPKRKDIVAYCRGPYCVLAFEAVAVLRARGYRARRLEDGFPAWKAAGLAVDTSA